MFEFFRAEWTSGRSILLNNKSHALVYNLIEGMAYYFEDESAVIIKMILSFPKNGQIPILAVQDYTKNAFSPDEIIAFFQELVEVGILTEGLLTKESVLQNRKLVGEFRKEQELSIKKTVQEKLPFQQSGAEEVYMDILEQNKIPFVVMFELTYNCNEKCIHCFNPGAARNLSEKSTRNDRDEINLTHYEKLLNELRELGVAKIILTGGDPFVKKDIWKLIDLIYQKDFAFDIYTNGLAILGKVDKIAKFYPRSIGLSIYSADEKIHDTITQVKGSLSKSLMVAKDALIFGIPLYFKCPIMNTNAKSYYSVVELAKEYGAIPQIDITLTDSVDGDTSIGEQLQVDGELLEIILRDPNIPLYVGPEAPNYGRQERDRTQAFCGAGTSLMNITPEGDVTPCNSFPTQFGNLKNQTFQEIWNKSKELEKWQSITINDYEECGTHEKCGYCNRCPGQSFIEHGNPLKASSANCKIAIARMTLAQKLKSGIDPLVGKSIETKLQEYSFEPDVEIHSNKNLLNFRNKSLDIL
jgi:radical SAM protein with 4Fe4S-binding SPASM domain